MANLSQEQITIIGGGITGLALAYIAAKSGRSVRIIEAQEKFGGLLNTFEVGESRLERYYHHFFTHDVELRWLLRELEMEDQLRFSPTTMGVFRRGEIYPFDSPMDLLRFGPMNLLGKIRFGLSGLFLGRMADWRKYESVSALSWFRKWGGQLSDRITLGTFVKHQIWILCGSSPTCMDDWEAAAKNEFEKSG